MPWFSALDAVPAFSCRYPFSSLLGDIVSRNAAPMPALEQGCLCRIMAAMQLPHSLIGTLVGLALCLALAGSALGDEIRVAVASNFSTTLQALAERFQAQTGHSVMLSSGSTGKHYAQIVNGAPFDAFFAADAQRPALLEEAGRALPGSRFTYAQGRLLLWSPRVGYVDAQGKVLHDKFRHLAIANPGLAPYGRAAQEVLQALGVWSEVADRLVRGENIAQTFQFIASGNAELGFVACAQVKRPDAELIGSWWEVPQNLHTPITQQAVLLTEHAAAREFLAFVRGPEARHIIENYGYRLP